MSWAWVSYLVRGQWSDVTMTNIWPLFVWSQPGQRMSRSPGLMGSIDVRRRERGWHSLLGEGRGMSDIWGSEVWLLWHSSDVTCDVWPGRVRPVSHHSIITDIMTRRLNAQYKATKRLDSYLLSQFKSWMPVGRYNNNPFCVTCSPALCNEQSTGWILIVGQIPESKGKTASKTLIVTGCKHYKHFWEVQSRLVSVIARP